MKWYSPNTKTAVVGLSPFDGGGLTERTTVDPFGNMGGDTNSGAFEPSSGAHHMNDYFSEENKNYLIEKLMEDRKYKKKKKLKRKRTILKSENSKWYKESQFGQKGPTLPTFDFDTGAGDWVSKTYENLMGAKEQREDRKNAKPNPSSTLVEVQGIKNVQGFCINDNIILTINSAIGNKKPSVKKDGTSFSAFVLASNPDLDIAVLAVANPNFKVEIPSKLADSSASKGSKRLSNEAGSPVLTNDDFVAGILMVNNSILPINSVKDWLRKNGVDFLE